LWGCAALLVSLMAWARLVETAHLLTDVVGGVSTGVTVTLGAALLLDRRSVRRGLIQLHTPDQAADRAEDKEDPSDRGRL
jgi:membrane-associated phospholipid phosphatase